MKKQIIIFLTLSILLAVAGGTYLLVMLEHRASDFDDLILLHQVEILREQLLLNIRTVEADFYTQRTRHPESIDAVVSHVNTMENTIKACLECHHEEGVLDRLYDLDKQIEQFSHALSRTLTLRADDQRVQDEMEKAHLIGDSLISKVNTMIILTNSKLNQRTENALQDVRRTSLIIIMLIAAGPLMIAILGFSALGGFTKPIQVLLEATRKVKAGNLDFRIAGLKNEFAELGDAFDDMAISLAEHRQIIEESEQRYRQLFESAADAIFILSIEEHEIGKILQANQAAARMHGYSVDELLTMSIKDLDTPDAALGIPMRIDRMLGGERLRMEIVHRKKDGTVFPVDISAGFFEVGGRKYILAIDRDITERKQAEESLQRAQQIKVAGEMATGLAHEIKNPLAGIKVTMEMLSEEAYLSEEDRSALRKVIAEIRRIEYLMKGLLNFARPPKPQFIKTDVNAVLETVVSVVLKDPAYSRDASHAIRIVKKYGELLPDALADPMQLQQIFMNLLLNAADAMPGGGTLVLETGYDPVSDFLEINISDTGAGIDAAVMSNVFQPFFTTKAKGTGLGLAITKRLVEEHEGQISIANSAEGGALFKLKFPAYREGDRQA
jgi:two-component system sensor histidine kinase AtoS